jgi:hypothetical protein
MIRAEDTDFHTPPDVGHTWSETNFFCASIPEERLMITFYTLFRKGIGVMLSDIVVFGAFTNSRAELVYLDSQQHLPACENLSDYTTANGLTIKALTIRDYQIDYVGFDNTEAHLKFVGLHEPFDIHDPAHSPRAVADMAGRAATAGQGEAYAHHFDLTGHITGTLTVRGTTYRVDCIETMDHSWGRRPEVGLRTLGWMHAHFGKDLALHWINQFDLERKTDRAHALAHGYVLEDGRITGLSDLDLRVTRQGTLPIAIEASATDANGRVITLNGAAQLAAPWTPYTCVLLGVALMRWTLPDGRVGYGHVQEVYPLDMLTRLRHKYWSDIPSIIAT